MYSIEKIIHLFFSELFPYSERSLRTCVEEHLAPSEDHGGKTVSPMSRLDDWKGDQSVLPCRGPAIDQSHVSEVKEWREEDGRGPDRFWRCSLTIDVGHEVESCCCGLSPSAARGQRIPWPEFIILFVMNYLVEGLFAHGKYFTCLLRRLPQQRQSGTVHHHHQPNPRPSPSPPYPKKKLHN